MKNGSLHFEKLPAFANFILQEDFDSFLTRMAELTEKTKINFLAHIAHLSPQQRLSLRKTETSLLLQALAANDPQNYIQSVIGRFTKNEIAEIASSEILVSDIKRYNFAFQAAMLRAIPSYSKDPELVVSLATEIANFFMELEQNSLNAVVAMQDARLDEILYAETSSRKLLQEREQQLLEAQELGGMGSFVWDLTSGSSTFTPQLKKVLGIQAPVPVAEIAARVHPDDLVAVRKAFSEAIETIGSYDLEFRLLVDGSIKFAWSKGMVTGENGKALAIRGTVIDITEKHQLLAGLQRSESLFKESQRLASLGNWSWDFQSDDFEWSEEMYRIFELEPYSVTMNPERISPYIHPDDREMRNEVIHEAIRSKSSYSIFYRILLDGGKEKILHSRGTATYDSEGKPLMLIGTAQDVTGQKRIEHQLIEQQMFIKKIADATPAIITTYDIVSQKFGFVSRGIEAILGYKQEILLNKRLDFLTGHMHPEDVQMMLNFFNDAVSAANEKSDDAIREFKFRVKAANGEFRWMSCFGTVFSRNKRGKVTQILTLLFDNTEEVEAENKILRQTVELQQSNASLEEFAHVASHDLKEPLRKISNFADRLLPIADALPAKGIDYLKKIVDAALRMQVLIDDLLSVSVISSEKTFKWYPLNKILDDVMQSLELKIEESKATVDVELDFHAYIIPSQLRQLFQNLLLNSMKFTRPGEVPKITISGLIVSPWAVRDHPVKKAEKYLQIRVADRGIGFDPQFAQQIFAIFQRLHLRSQYEGTGIGLAICKKIVENHGGVIFASGKKDSGAVFTILLPLAES